MRLRTGIERSKDPFACLKKSVKINERTSVGNPLTSGWFRFLLPTCFDEKRVTQWRNFPLQPMHRLDLRNFFTTLIPALAKYCNQYFRRHIIFFYLAHHFFLKKVIIFNDTMILWVYQNWLSTRAHRPILCPPSDKIYQLQILQSKIDFHRTNSKSMFPVEKCWQKRKHRFDNCTPFRPKEHEIYSTAYRSLVANLYWTVRSIKVNFIFAWRYVGLWNVEMNNYVLTIMVMGTTWLAISVRLFTSLFLTANRSAGRFSAF